MKWVCLAAFAFLAVLPLPATASHYDLSSIDLVDDAVLGRLDKLGIKTTEDLWNATRSSRRLVRLARRVKVPQIQMREWRDFCDMLYVRGVGPKVVRILRYAGVRRLKRLAREDPAGLAERIRKENRKHGVLGKLPGSEMVEDWVEQARDLVRKRKRKR